MKGKDILSAVVGSAFFAVPYTLLSISLPPALIIGASAFTASELIFSSVKQKEDLKSIDKPLYIKINNAKKQNKEIQNFIPKVENLNTKLAVAKEEIFKLQEDKENLTVSLTEAKDVLLTEKDKLIFKEIYQMNHRTPIND